MTYKSPIELSAACEQQLATQFDDASRERAFEAFERWLRTPEAYPPSPIDDGGCTVTVGGVILEIRESPLGGIVISRIVLAAGGPSHRTATRDRGTRPHPRACPSGSKAPPALRFKGVVTALDDEQRGRPRSTERLCQLAETAIERRHGRT
jgi:hypothetical protein